MGGYYFDRNESWKLLPAREKIMTEKEPFLYYFYSKFTLNAVVIRWVFLTT